ncbi:NAD-dependent epimerase/dehydratase family protein [Neobacillus pocheonensis]|uniref:NAD-dependent epimerase/dehydratase family protein n=1 Tax=Neobacillus pocheonensis TaxID=363869 RepID=UPI003D2CD55F
MKILVLGGSRFLGRTFVEEALAKNHDVTIFNRGNQNDGFKDVEIIKGDRFGDLKELGNRYWDAVLDTSGFIPFTVQNTTKLLKDRVKQYTFISSISVYKDWIPENLDETYPVLEMSLEEANVLTKDLNGPVYEHYGHFKALCERIALQNLPGRVLNIRAGQLIGPNDYTDRIPYWVHRISKGGKVLAPGSPMRRVQVIDNKDLSKWILSMMEVGTAGTFNATGPNYPLSMSEFLEACIKVTGSDAELVWADEKFLVDQGVAPWTELPLYVPENYPLASDLTVPWKGTFSINIDKAVANGLTFRPLEDSLTDIFAWEKTRTLSADEWKSGLRLEKERKLLQLLAQN